MIIGITTEGVVKQVVGIIEEEDKDWENEETKEEQITKENIVDG